MLRRSLIIVSLALAALALGSSIQGSADVDAQGPPSHVASAFGRAMIGGQEVFVHVTVASVSAGDAQAAAQAELHRRGAVPVQSAEYSKNGTWKQFSDSSVENPKVVLRYNPDDEVTNYQGTSSDWTEVETSAFEFSWGADIPGDCPSLVDECDGPQQYNGANEAGWLDLGGVENNSITLGVTWFNFKARGRFGVQEADMVLNTLADWGAYDALTVAAHELGHVAGLGHSSDSGALMYPWYQDLRNPLLGDDDKAGITALYPASDGSEPEAGSSWCTTHDMEHKAYAKKCG